MRVGKIIAFHDLIVYVILVSRGSLDTGEQRNIATDAVAANLAFHPMRRPHPE